MSAFNSSHILFYTAYPTWKSLLFPCLRYVLAQIRSSRAASTFKSHDESSRLHELSCSLACS
eukprot:2252056-Pleurochrysis_carterae.AAC.1